MELTKDLVAQTMTDNGIPTTPDQVTDEMLKETSEATDIPIQAAELAEVPEPVEAPTVTPTSPPSPDEATAGKVSFTVEELTAGRNDPNHPAYGILKEVALGGDPQGDPNHLLHARLAEKDAYAKKLEMELAEARKAIPDLLHDASVNDPSANLYGGILLEDAMGNEEAMAKYLEARDTYRDAIHNENLLEERTLAEKKSAWDKTVADFKSRYADADVDSIVRRNSRYLPDGSENPDFRPLSLEMAYGLQEIESAGGLEAFKKKLLDQDQRSVEQPKTPLPPPFSPPGFQSLSSGDGNVGALIGTGLPQTQEQLVSQMAQGREFSLQEITDMEKAGLIPKL